LRAPTHAAHRIGELLREIKPAKGEESEERGISKGRCRPVGFPQIRCRCCRVEYVRKEGRLSIVVEAPRTTEEESAPSMANDI